jgi:hypothetical protein
MLSPTQQGDEAMTTLTVDLPPALYEQLRAEAARTGQHADDLVASWIAERLTPQQSERDRAREVLRAAGLLAEPSPEMRERAARSTATLEEVSAALSRAGGTPLSEIIIEQRGPKA